MSGPGSMPGTSGSCCTSTPTGCRRSTCRWARRTSSTRRPTAERCTVALLLEVDPVGAGPRERSRRRRSRSASTSTTARTRRPRCWRSRSAGSSAPRSPGAARPARTWSTCRCRCEIQRAGAAAPGGADLVRAAVRAARLDGRRPRRAAGRARCPRGATRRYVDLRLTGTCRCADALTHLYVLLPVLDDAKHYWVGADEVDKLLRGRRGLARRPPGAGADHPPLPGPPARLRAPTPLDRLADARRRRPDRRSTTRPRSTRPTGGAAEEAPCRWRGCGRAAVLAELRGRGRRRVVDLGCGEGALLRGAAGRRRAFTEIVGADVSARALQHGRAAAAAGPAAGRASAARLTLLQSSLTYRDERLAGFDAAVLMEVVEHVDPPRLPALERVVFGDGRARARSSSRPRTRSTTCATRRCSPGGFRHADHRFEWTRARVRAAGRTRVGDRYGYTGPVRPVGDVDPEVGPADPAGRVQRPRQVGRREPRAEPIPAAEPRRPGRGVRVGQVHLRPPPLRPLRGDLQRLPAAAWSPTTRTTRPPPRTPSTCSTTSSASGWPPAGSPWSTRPTCSARPAGSAGRAGPRARRAAGGDRAGRARGGLRWSATGPQPTATFGAQVLRRQQRPAPPSLQGLAREGFRKVHVLRDVERGRRRPSVVRERLLNDRRDLTGPFDVDRRRARLPRRAGDAAGALGYALVRDDEGRPVDARPPRRAAGGVRRRPGRPRPGLPRRAAAGDGDGRGRARALPCPATTRTSWSGRCAGATSRSATAWPRRWPSWPREPPEFRADVEQWCYGLVSHLVLDGGRLVVAHAGLKEAYHGPGLGPGAQLRPVRRHHRGDRRVRAAGPLPVGRATTAAGRRCSTGTPRSRSRSG